ncbi:hypothetical protein SEA_WESAK_54 [Microbacterium phage Wesak]|uniref:Uncharacterized protein n=1 Tax=Microbacterium phage Wesak TaxID=2653751 RepID=A0A5Q2WH56_9CAUD|nr:hypothetical protein SEA_WESAK_54 [Microbacterium phage Wesak]
MAGPKDLLTPEQYKRWYARHKQVEKERQWRERLRNNPINALPLSERGKLPDTSSPL